MIKLIATDMDGTFLDNSHTVPKENITAYKLLKEKNIDFIVATGRAYYEALPTLQEANIKCPVICLNGGTVYDIDGNITHINKLPINDIKFIIDVFKKLNISYQLYTKNALYTKNVMDDVQIYIDLAIEHGADPNVENIIKDVKLRQSNGHLIEVANLEEFIDKEDNPTIKLLGLSNDKEKLDLAKKLLLENNNLAITSSGSNNIEVMHKNASKGNALSQYAKQQNISLNETMTFGDNLNDTSMLEITKYSVAMKNGHDTAKQVANYISDDTNNNAGVGKTILKFINKKEVN